MHAATPMLAERCGMRFLHAQARNPCGILLTKTHAMLWYELCFAAALPTFPALIIIARTVKQFVLS